MAFSQSLVSEPVLSRVGQQLQASWVSTAPSGTIFQLYVDRALAWSGTARVVYLPWPRTTIEVQVGTVGPGEATTDFSASLPGGHPDKVTLAWLGGTSQGADLAGFRVYGSATAGGAIDYTTTLADLPVTPTLDGYGIGGYGAAPFGASSLPYSWSSGRLGSGAWWFAVASYDTAGNESRPGVTTSVTIVGPPRPPAPDAAGKRLTYTLGTTTPDGYGANTFGVGGYGGGAAPLGYGFSGYGVGGFGTTAGVPAITLNWLASPLG